MQPDQIDGRKRQPIDNASKLFASSARNGADRGTDVPEPYAAIGELTGAEVGG